MNTNEGSQPTTEWSDNEDRVLRELGYIYIINGYASGQNKNVLHKVIDSLFRQRYYLDEKGRERDVDGDWGSCTSRSIYSTFEEMINSGNL